MTIFSANCQVIESTEGQTPEEASTPASAEIIAESPDGIFR